MAEPISPQKAPYQAQIEAGRKYAWCACGRSQKQPFCDGSHKDTGFTPIIYEASETKDVWFCGCKRSGTKPLCDGTHTRI